MSWSNYFCMLGIIVLCCVGLVAAYYIYSVYIFHRQCDKLDRAYEAASADPDRTGKYTLKELMEEA